jgi:methylated-DNA-[protein]-cysteine S-methyltransferase
VWLHWTTLRTPVPAPRPIASVTVGVSEVGLALVCWGGSDPDAVAGCGVDDGPDAGPGVVRAQLAEAGRRLGVAPERDEDGRTDELVGRLSDYLAGRAPRVDYPVDWRLTHGDQRVVLRTLYESVGYGQTVTYGELAERSGAYRLLDEPGAAGTGRRPMQAARRVGSIMGSNPVPLVVPCHRVLAADGLGGFGGGLETKRWLLTLEGVLPPTLDLFSV